MIRFLSSLRFMVMVSVSLIVVLLMGILLGRLGAWRMVMRSPFSEVSLLAGDTLMQGQLAPGGLETEWYGPKNIISATNIYNTVKGIIKPDRYQNVNFRNYLDDPDSVNVISAPITAGDAYVLGHNDGVQFLVEEGSEKFIAHPDKNGGHRVQLKSIFGFAWSHAFNMYLITPN